MRTRIVVISAAAVVVAGVAGVVMMRNHTAVPGSAPVTANALQAAPADAEVMRAITAAGVPIDGLSVRSAGGIYILRGSGDAAAAERAVNVMKGLGVVRVANLVTAAKTWNDDEIRRAAERELASRPALEGTRLQVACDEGVITVSGTVTHELQKDLARSTLASIRGAREVRIDLTKVDAAASQSASRAISR
jgi:osmotically-inducible protein OsmY